MARGRAARSSRDLAETLTALWHVFLPAVAIAYPVMLLFWPWAQTNPIENPFGRSPSSRTRSSPTAPFRGQYFPATDLPWAYLPTYIVLALPEIILILAIVAPVIACWLARGMAGGVARRMLRHSLVAFAIIFPVAYAVAIKAVLFDGMRHFIFVLPLIAVVAAQAADHLLDWLDAVRVPPAGLCRACALWRRALAVMAMLHPNEYVYYNGFIGGVEGAQGLFKLDYWANSYSEAVDGLEDYLQAEYGLDYMDHDFTVAVCGPPISADYFFPKNFDSPRIGHTPISSSPSPRTIATNRCPGRSSTASSAWARCCPRCSTGATSSRRRAARTRRHGRSSCRLRRISN